jgi:hypothetical protein
VKIILGGRLPPGNSLRGDCSGAVENFVERPVSMEPKSLTQKFVAPVKVV